MDDFHLIPMRSLDPDGDLLKDQYLDVYQMGDVQGSDVLDDLINKGLVKANPKRGSNTNKKEAFQDFLNRGGSQLVAEVPSQMPGAMGGATPGGMIGSTIGGIPTHGIAGNVGAKLGETIGGAFKEGKEAAGDLFNRLLNRRMQNLGTGDLMGMGGIG